MSTTIDISALAARLDDAARNAIAVPQLDLPLTLEQAYAIQAAAFARRLSRGERRIGVKMGFTSQAKMAQMGIDEVIWGRLSDAMMIEKGGNLPFSKYVHPRVEPEIAFLLKAPLPAAVTPEEALAAVEGIAPALEIIDSRYLNFKFSLTDVVADNSSSSSFAVGDWTDPQIDFADLDLVLEIDGKAVKQGSSAAILGHPIRSLVAAARLAAAAGEPLQAGDIILAGGATEAVALEAGQHIRLVGQHIGHVEFHVER